MNQEANLLDGEVNLDELFNESNMINLKEVKRVLDFDKDGNPIIHQKPAARFEELHCAEYDKYLVPLFIIKGDEESFIGNGVVVDNYLITAAHVVVCDKCRRNLNQIYFRIERDYIEVNDDMLIHDGRDPYGRVVPDENNIHDDLIVYELNEKYNSFKLSGESVNIGDELAMMSYRSNPENEEKILPEKTVCKVSILNKGRLKNQILDWKNCYIVNNQWFFSPGNSGSALFNKENVYGMLITANRDGFGPIGTVIEARYIRDVIDKYEAKN